MNKFLGGLATTAIAFIVVLILASPIVFAIEPGAMWNILRAMAVCGSVLLFVVVISIAKEIGK